MHGSRWLVLSFVAAVALTGCKGGPSKQVLASAEPALSPPIEGGATIVEGTPPQTLTFVDRHPLLSKPRDIYESTGQHPLVKSAAAVVVGVPVGIFGELKQIVVGSPPGAHY